MAHDHHHGHHHHHAPADASRAFAIAAALNIAFVGFEAIAGLVTGSHASLVRKRGLYARLAKAQDLDHVPEEAAG